MIKGKFSEDRKILSLLKTHGADLEVTNDATDNIQPRTKEFVHLSTEITSLFYKIITKTT